MLLGWYTKQWWTLGNDTNCTPQQLSQAVEGYFSVDSLNFIIGKRKSISGLTTEKFLEKYRQVDATTHHSAYVQLTYDTVWTVALTLRETMLHWEKNDIKDVSLSDFTYHEGAVLKEAFFSIMGDLEFTGVSGPISFDGPDRRGITVIEQNQGGEEVRIALFYPENNTLDFKCEGCTPVYWKNDKVPADKFTILTRQEHVGTAAFYTVFTVGSFGIIFAVVFLAFNLHYRKLKYIKLSSPRLNNVAVIGCLLVYTAVILLGLDDATLDMQFFPLVCSLRAFLLAAGFSMAFGAMFTKTYRVHQILTRTSSGLVKSRLLKDKQLLFIIGALLIVDSIIISLWVLIDPMDRQVQNFTVEASDTDEDLLYIPQLSKCHSQHLDKWMGVFYAYKGLLLIFGVYMAWETRHVKIPALNDSQYIGLNVYNVVLMSVIVVALSSLLADQPTLSYAVVSAFIILSTTIMLCLLFLPKFYAIIKHSGNPVITTSGLMVEANTRRFATDDKKEQFYRAEVQNRVYKREIVELDQEIIRLERMLELPLEPFTKMTDELMYLLPESKVDTTPIAIRRRKAELERCDSITDADDVATDLPSISFGSLPVIEKRKLEKEDSGFHTMSFKNSNFKTLEQERLEIDNEEEDHTNGRCSVSRNRKLTRGLSNDSAIEPSLSYGSIRRQNSFDGDQEEKCSLLMEDEEREQAENEIELLFGHTDANSYRSNSVGAAEAFGCREILTSPTEHGSRTSIELSDFSSKSGATNTVTPNGAEGHNDFQKRKVTVMEKPSSIRTFESDSYELDDSERDSLSPKQMSKPERRRRIRILQRELARIQQELKNLGDIEMEVSYV